MPTPTKAPTKAQLAAELAALKKAAQAILVHYTDGDEVSDVPYLLPREVSAGRDQAWRDLKKAAEA